MSNLMGSGATAVANAVPNWMVPAKTLSYQAPATPAADDTIDPAFAKVPMQYRGAVTAAAAHTGIPAGKLAGQFLSENGGNWDPALRGRADPTDMGVTQLNPIAIQTITGAKGGANYFQSNYGRPFDATNPTDQILGAGVYLNWLRQYALPAAGIKNPTDEQVMTAYNTGAQGLANAATGSAPAVRRAGNYQALLARNGAI